MSNSGRLGRHNSSLTWGCFYRYSGRLGSRYARTYCRSKSYGHMKIYQNAEYSKHFLNTPRSMFIQFFRSRLISFVIQLGIKVSLLTKQVYLNKRKEKRSIGDVRSARQSTQNISVGGKIVNVKTKDMFSSEADNTLNQMPLLILSPSKNLIGHVMSLHYTHSMYLYVQIFWFTTYGI